MGELIRGDDGLPAEIVGIWAKEKHAHLCRYIDIASAVRRKWIGPSNAGATYIDVFCGPGRCLIRDSEEWIDGGCVSAWKKSVETGSPFTNMYLGDKDEERLFAACSRLKSLGAPVVPFVGPALQTVTEIISHLNPYGLHLAFLDPYNLESLNFRIIEELSRLKRIDMLVHISQMDLQRNLISNIGVQDAGFDLFAPGWVKHVDVNQGQQAIRHKFFEYWRGLVSARGIESSTDMRLVSGSNNQPLYLLLLAAKHELARKFWEASSSTKGQQSLF